MHILKYLLILKILFKLNYHNVCHDNLKKIIHFWIWV